MSDRNLAKAVETIRHRVHDLQQEALQFPVDDSRRVSARVHLREVDQMRREILERRER